MAQVSVNNHPGFSGILAAVTAVLLIFGTGCTTPPTRALTTMPTATAAPTITPTSTPASALSAGSVIGSAHTVVVEEDTFQGVIISAEMAHQQNLGYLILSDVPQFWTPNPAQVAAMEAQLLPFLRSDERLRDGIGWRRVRPLEEALPTFTRQYFGYKVANGDEMIYASFFCDIPLAELRKRWVEVMDGGDCYFQVRYNVTTGVPESLQVNGEA